MNLLKLIAPPILPSLSPASFPSLTAGSFPSIYKHGLTLPPLKRNLLNLTFSTSHYSISLLFFVAKLLKRIAYIHCLPLISFYSLSPIMSPPLHQTAPIKVTNDLHAMQFNGQFSALILTWPTSSTGTADGHPLLSSLSSVGFQEPTLFQFPLASLAAPSQSPLLAPPLLLDLLKWECPRAQSMFFFSFLSTVTPLVISSSLMTLNNIYMLMTPRILIFEPQPNISNYLFNISTQMPTKYVKYRTTNPHCSTTVFSISVDSNSIVPLSPPKNLEPIFFILSLICLINSSRNPVVLSSR